MTNRELYDEADKILAEFKSAVKIKKICKDGFGFNYGIRAELTPEALNSHVQHVRQKRLDLQDRFKFLLSHIDL